jgi:hypothetical protein
MGFPAGVIGACLTLSGCTLGGWWLVVLSQGKSAAELPDPITIIYPVILIAAGVFLVTVSGVCLVTLKRLNTLE